MELIRGLRNWRPRHHGCVATMGNFDGVHYGHQMLIAHLNAKSDELGLPGTLVTFEPLSHEFLGSPETAPPRLTRFREKIRLLQHSGLDRVLLLPFNDHMRSIEAEEMINELLVRRMGVGYVVVGDDFHFGRAARGDYAMLEAAGAAQGFGVSHMGTLTFEHGRVSSSRIREVLQAGDFPVAEHLLGRPYSICGKVVHGRELGRQLGVPTANVRLQRNRCALHGVYAVTVEMADGRRCPGVANLGMRPTVDGHSLMLEVHLLDFTGDLYGHFLEVFFVAKLRDEVQFPDIDALKAQIDRDVGEARAILGAAAGE